MGTQRCLFVGTARALPNTCSMVTGHILLEVPVCTLSEAQLVLPERNNRNWKYQGGARSKDSRQTRVNKHKKHPFCEAGPHFIGWAQMI